MPTLHSMHLSKPKNWQEFEDIVCDAQSMRWISTDLQKNGRTGQKQSGVDIYGSDDIGRRVGIQCKLCNATLTLKTVEKEIANAEKFKGILSTLYFATTAENDAKLQQIVRILSDKRVASGKFAVGLLFWDDIVGGLILNPTIFSSHYPQIRLPEKVGVNKESLIASLELGYYGAYLWEFVELLFGEFGLMANVDPDEINPIIRIIEQRASQLLPPRDYTEIYEMISEVRSGCASKKQSASDWNPVERNAKRIQSRVKGASSLLPIETSNLLDLAVSLGNIYHHTDDLPRTRVIDQIKRKVRGVLIAPSDLEIDGIFSDAAAATSGFEWAPKIYTAVDREIRWA